MQYCNVNIKFSFKTIETNVHIGGVVFKKFNIEKFHSKFDGDFKIVYKTFVAQHIRQ